MNKPKSLLDDLCQKLDLPFIELFRSKEWNCDRSVFATPRSKFNYNFEKYYEELNTILTREINEDK